MMIIIIVTVVDDVIISIVYKRIHDQIFQSYCQHMIDSMLVGMKNKIIIVIVMGRLLLSYLY